MFGRRRVSRAARRPAEDVSVRSVELVDADDYAAPVNRSALIIRVKQPFIDWVNSLDDGPRAELRTCEPTLMLVDEMEDPAEWPHVEKGLWGRIFEYQLGGWHRDPRGWPHPRTIFMFREWFDVELHLGVYDASDDPMLEL